MRSNVLAAVESHRCFGGTQSVYMHNSETTRSPMKVGVFQPEGEGPFPVLYFLSGLTCTEQNFITKGHVQRYAAEVGMMVVAPYVDVLLSGHNLRSLEDFAALLPELG